MKKKFVMLLALLMGMLLAGCGSGNTKIDTGDAELKVSEINQLKNTLDGKKWVCDWLSLYYSSDGREHSWIKCAKGSDGTVTVQTNDLWMNGKLQTISSDMGWISEIDYLDADKDGIVDKDASIFWSIKIAWYPSATYKTLGAYREMGASSDYEAYRLNIAAQDYKR